MTLFNSKVVLSLLYELIKGFLNESLQYQYKTWYQYFSLYKGYKYF